jgi:hypothetical protein
MSFEPHTCVVLICDGPAECDPWDDGTPHFDDEAEAVEYAEHQGWTFPPGRALCGACTRDEECASSGHVWDDWQPKEQYGVTYRSRWCERCSDTDYDPPFAQLAERLRVIHDAEDVLRGVKP